MNGRASRFGLVVLWAALAGVWGRGVSDGARAFVDDGFNLDLEPTDYDIRTQSFKDVFKPRRQETSLPSPLRNDDESSYLPLPMRKWKYEPRTFNTCDPDLYSTFFPIIQKKPYAPFEWNNQFKPICPNLKLSCCEAHLVHDKLNEFEAIYQRFMGFRRLEMAVQAVKPKNPPTDERLKAMLTLNEWELREIDLPMEEVLDLFLANFQRHSTNLVKVINPIMKYHSGFICQFCHIDSYQYFNLIPEDGGNPTFRLKEEDPKLYLEVANKVLWHERIYAESYRLLQLSKAFREQPIEHVDFDTPEEYAYLQESLNECIKNQHSRLMVYRRPACTSAIEAIGWKNRAESFYWIKEFYNNVITSLDTRLPNKDELMDEVQQLPDWHVIWVPIANTTLNFSSLDIYLNYTAGFSMTERPLMFHGYVAGAARVFLPALLAATALSQWLL